MKAARAIWEKLADQELLGFVDTPNDEVRRELDHRLVVEVLGGSIATAEALHRVSAQLVSEPMVYVRA